MATVTQSQHVRKPRQVTRTVRVVVPAFGNNPAVIRIAITTGVRNPKTVSTDYAVRRIPSDFGCGFELVKLMAEEPAVYHVLLEQDGRSCDCKGHLQHGHCKHADAVLKLVQLGKLPVELPRPAVQVGAA
jgi:hypothetical protein